MYCHTSNRDKILGIEHIIPVTKDGRNIAENLAMACPNCNASKGNKELHEWFMTPYCVQRAINWNTTHPDVEQKFNKMFNEEIK